MSACLFLIVIVASLVEAESSKLYTKREGVFRVTKRELPSTKQEEDVHKAYDASIRAKNKYRVVKFFLG
ncbi:hypothetical protein RRG08_032872 [Elysia crispata]|uniref:Uncharacterized protein n=1 Tax=Elysia crispata TaxID=231223 RepID=A0AAE1DIS3_9GAST|nr:hypothetical protein RRG08_032872 [Elysia crispata]